MIYCGKAINLRKRVSSYFLNKDLGEKTKKLVEQINKIKTIHVNSEIEAFLLEEKLIKKYSPKYNVMLKDDKAYPLVRINIKDKYPAVLIVRKKKDDKSIYFGPYTSTGSLKTVLKLIRKIFPYQSVLNHSNKVCLYNHLGLCPCPQVLGNLEYKKNLKHIVDFMNGNTTKVIRDLEKERDIYSKNENFEISLQIQKKIDSIKLITSPFYKPFQYEENPNFKSDILKKELDELLLILNSNGLNITKLKRIECFDISNTSGTNATASMVVLINGERDTSLYRRFKIKRKYKSIPNDFAMMQEVITRRLSHINWGTPDLIVVDGGKGQVSSAKKVLDNLSIKIPIIGLAKKEETIVLQNLKLITLPSDSKSLHLIMKIRDEAHRFAINYHRKLRSKFIYE